MWSIFMLHCNKAIKEDENHVKVHRNQFEESPVGQKWVRINEGNNYNQIEAFQVHLSI